MLSHQPGLPVSLRDAGRVRVAGERVQHQNGVGPAGVQVSVGFVGDIDFGKRYAAVEIERRETHQLRFNGKRHCVLAR